MLVRTNAIDCTWYARTGLRLNVWICAGGGNIRGAGYQRYVGLRTVQPALLEAVGGILGGWSAIRPVLLFAWRKIRPSCPPLFCGLAGAKPSLPTLPPHLFLEVVCLMPLHTRRLVRAYHIIFISKRVSQDLVLTGVAAVSEAEMCHHAPFWCVLPCSARGLSSPSGCKTLYGPARIIVNYERKD